MMEDKQDIPEFLKLFKEIADIQKSKDKLGSTNDWLDPLKEKLYTMLCSPMKDDYMREAFNWISQLCFLYDGFEWISPDGQWAKDDEMKMFLCIARSSLSELQILIPLLERRLICGEEPEVEDGVVVAKSANSEDYDTFGAHLLIIENVIQCLVATTNFDEDDDSDSNQLTENMKSDDLKNLLEHLKETLSSVIEYLELVNDNWDKLTKSHDDKSYTSIIASLRITCIWLSEDIGSFQEECERFLICLFVKILKSDEGDIKDSIVTVLHRMCTDDAKLLNILRNCPGYREALIDYRTYVTRLPDFPRHSKKQESKLNKLRFGLVDDLLKSE